MTGHDDKVYSLAVAPDGTIASGDSSAKSGCGTRGGGQAGAMGAFCAYWPGRGRSVGSLSFSPDGKLLLSGVRSKRGQ